MSVLSITADHLRVFLHVLAAAVWVGGHRELTVVGLLPAARGLGAEAGFMSVPNRLLNASIQ